MTTMNKLLASIAIIPVLASCTPAPGSTDMNTNSNSDTPAAEVSTSMYKTFTASAEEAVKGNEPYVLFFHFAWCSTCKALDKDLTAQASDLKGTVLKADFDADTELKAKYGVTTQHSILFFNKEGELTDRKVGIRAAELISTLNENVGS